MSGLARCLALMLALALCVPDPARAWTGDDVPADTTEVADAGADDAEVTAIESPAPAVTPARALDALRPEVAAAPFRIQPGVRPYRGRLTFSPGLGRLGSEALYSFRIAYHPDAWLGYEGSVEHNPGRAVHAALHMVSVVVRRPLPGRLQPYASAGYGMVMVFPGRSLNADPVTKNAVAVGGGIEFYLRGDLSLRGEIRRATVFGREGDRDGIVAFDYLQQIVGLSFHRTLRP